MDANALVAWNVRRLRVALGLSQEALAAEAGLDRTYVGRIERGEENPTVRVLEHLATALGENIVKLFDISAATDATPAPLRGGRKPSRKAPR